MEFWAPSVCGSQLLRYAARKKGRWGERFLWRRRTRWLSRAAIGAWVRSGQCHPTFQQPFLFSSVHAITVKNEETEATFRPSIRCYDPQAGHGGGSDSIGIAKGRGLFLTTVRRVEEMEQCHCLFGAGINGQIETDFRDVSPLMFPFASCGDACAVVASRCRVYAMVCFGLQSRQLVHGSRSASTILGLMHGPL